MHYYLGKYVERLRRPRTKIQTFPCPTCRSEFTLQSNRDVAKLPSSYFIKNMLEIIAIQQKAKTSPSCSMCESPAVGHCGTCEAFMCSKCSEGHKTWHGNHDVLSVEELCDPESHVKVKRKLLCKEHEEKILEYYCETCEDLSCIDCVVLNHQKPDHLCVTMRAIAQKTKKTLQSSCGKLDKKVFEAKEALNNIVKVIMTLENNAKTAKDQIKEEKENILKMVEEKLNEKEKKMNEEVDKIYGELHKELSEQLDEIKEYLDKVQASVLLPKSLLKRGSIEEIVSSQKLIDEHIKTLTKERPKDCTAVNDGAICFVPSRGVDVNALASLSEIGYIGGM